jgi:hypothetical protein
MFKQYVLRPTDIGRLKDASKELQEIIEELRTEMEDKNPANLTWVMGRLHAIKTTVDNLLDEN